MSQEELVRRLDLVEARLDELTTRFESVPKLLELLALHEDAVRGGGDEDLVEGL